MYVECCLYKTSYMKISCWALGNGGGYFSLFCDILQTKELINRMQIRLIDEN